MKSEYTLENSYYGVVDLIPSMNGCAKQNWGKLRVVLFLEKIWLRGNWIIFIKCALISKLWNLRQ